LGLAIAKSQIEIMCGRLAVQSQLGVGSTFSFTLEMALTQHKAAAAFSRTVSRLAAGYTIRALVADDVDVNREVLSAVLRDAGITVVEARDGFEAVVKAREEPLDVVFMDIRMPVMDGSAAIRHIRERGEDRLKIVATTAFVLADERDRLMQLGCDAFIAKPFRRNLVFDTLRDLLHVEFVYDDEGPALAPVTASAVADIPNDLRQRLLSAAEIYQTTEIKRCVAELQALSGSDPAVTDRISALAKSLDMPTLITFLKHLETP
jgi:CheY-like chemotaxis protein